MVRSQYRNRYTDTDTDADDHDVFVCAYSLLEHANFIIKDRDSTLTMTKDHLDSDGIPLKKTENAKKLKPKQN